MGVVMETGAGHLDEIEAFFADFENASDAEDWARYGDMFPSSSFWKPVPGLTGQELWARDDLVASVPAAPQSRIRSARARPAHDSPTCASRGSTNIHVLARTTWDVVFDHEHASVQLRSTYVLRHEDRWRIAMYLNHGSLLDLLGLTAPA